MSHAAQTLRASFKKDRPIWVIFGVSTFVMLLFMLVAYRALMFSVLDLGLFNRHMYSLVHFDLSANPLKGFNLLGDHAHIFLLALAPLYAIWPDPRTLLIIQVLVVTTSVFPVYFLARHYLHSRLASSLWVIAYLAFYGIWAALAAPFHDSPVAVLPIAWALYHLLVSKNMRALIVWLVILCLVREDMPLVVAMFGLYLMLIDRRRKLGLSIVVASLAYMWVIIGVVMARLGPGYLYTQNPFGDSMTDVVRAAITRPVEVLRQVFWSPSEKLSTLTYMLASFGGLSLLAPHILLLALPLWLGRTLTLQPWRWGTDMHYGASQAPFLVVSAIIGLAGLMHFVQRKLKLSQRHAAMMLVGVSMLVVGLSVGISVKTQNNQLRWLLWRDVYALTPEKRSAYDAMKLIPKEASVAVQSPFVPLTGRRRVYNVPFDIDSVQPEYVITINQDIPSPFASTQELDNFRQQLLRRGYQATFSQQGVVLLRRAE